MPLYFPIFYIFEGEVLIEVASATASVDFEWVLPWDSSLVAEVSRAIGLRIADVRKW